LIPGVGPFLSKGAKKVGKSKDKAEGLERIAEVIEKKDFTSAPGGMITADSYSNALNVNPAGGKPQDQENPENERQTKDKTKTTKKKKSQDNIVDPSIFYSNTIDLTYDF